MNLRLIGAHNPDASEAQLQSDAIGGPGAAGDEVVRQGIIDEIETVDPRSRTQIQQGAGEHEQRCSARRDVAIDTSAKRSIGASLRRSDTFAPYDV